MKPSEPPLGPVMLDLRGTTLLPEEIDLLAHPMTGGVILFSRNYESPEQIMALIASIRERRPDLLVAVDHEGGRVQRFRCGFTRLPSAAAYAGFFGQDLNGLLTALEYGGWLMASELRAVGVDFSFAPVLDVDCGISEIIGDRSFSQDPVQAGDFARAFALGMRRAGMAAVGKHFPGHGSVALDSHLALPEDPRPFTQIAARDLLPFKTLIQAGLEGVMPAHVVYSAVDDKPAGFSKKWIGEVLRRQLGFDGAVFSDDLSMAGAAFAGDYGTRARLALEAGCDMALICNQPDATGTVLEALTPLAVSSHQARLARLRGRFFTDRKDLLASAQWRTAIEHINPVTEWKTA